MTAEQQKQWMAQWKSAAVALEKVREEELRSLSEAEAVGAAQALMELPGPERVSDRESGLVAQQQLFAKARRS